MRKPPKTFEYDRIVAFDTETYEGVPYIISSSDDDYTDTNSFDDCLHFLTASDYDKTLNYFYNIKYDTNAILKFLDRNILNRLYFLGQVELPQCKIKYIPKRYLEFQIKKKKYCFFDLFQFFNMSLDAACKKFLGKGKKDIDHGLFADKSYIDANKSIIIEECIQDSILTKELGEYFIELFSKIGISFPKPYSTAYLSQCYFMNKCNIPITYNTQFQKYAFYSYSGGRFEVFKRGLYENIYNYDINSAYPFEIANLVDISNGKWIYEKIVPDDAYYGFIRCYISHDQENISPLPYNYKSLVIYPQLKKQLSMITLEEYKFITENNLGNIEVVDGWFFYPYVIEHPFKKEVEYLYNERLKLKKESNPLEHVIKIILNSFYGKNLQMTPFLKKLKDDCIYDENVIDFIDEGIEGSYIKLFKTGQLFNPIYASIITANTRLKCHQFILDNYAEHDTLAIFTDGVISTKKLLSNNSKQLGDWAQKNYGDIVLLGSGVYTVRNKDDTFETRFRGFNTSVTDDTTKKKKKVDFFSILENNDTCHVKIKRERPVGLGEWINHNIFFNEYDLNRFLFFDKTLDINFDRKRVWDRPFKNCKDVLRSQIESTTRLI